MSERAPLMPKDCDMTGMEFMPLQVGKLFGSDFWLMANRLEKLAAMTLWAKSWHQVPAGSIPSDDRILAGMSEMGEDWPKVRDMALHGWVKCSDGRLYHPRVCEIALVAYIDRLGHRINSGAGNSRRWGVPFDPWPIVDRIGEANQMLLAINPSSEKTLKINVDKLPARNSSGDDDGAGIGSGSPNDPKYKYKDKVKGKGKGKEVGGKPPTTPGASADERDPAPTDSTADAQQPAGETKADQATTPKATPQKTHGGSIDGLALPEWMPAEEWSNFVELRRKMGKSIPFTLAAAKGIVRDLGKLRDKGQDPAAVLQQSVNLGYRGVFAVKGQLPVRVATRESRYAAAGRAIFGGGDSLPAGGNGVIDV